MTATEQARPVRSAWMKASTPALGWLWLLAPLLIHGGFSWIGFSPTDDGWQQAVARRLADGQVPHRDFIYIRPVLTPWLQVPFVWWGGDHIIWWSRLWGWLTLGGACWIWSGRVAGGAPFALRYAGYFAALLLCAHTFPVMAWSTLDGMLLASLALWLVARDTAGSWALGFFTAGLAALCRQNFVLFAPLLLLASGAPVRRWWAAGFWAALPGLAYVGAMTALGAGPDLWQQISATGGPFLDIAVRRFLINAWFFGGLVTGALGAWWSIRKIAAANASAGRASGWVGRGLFLALGGALAFVLGRDPIAYDEVAFALLGAVAALSAVAWRRWSRADRLTHGAALALAWAVSISLGKNTPVLMTGVLFLLGWKGLTRHDTSRAGVAAMLAVAIAVALGFSAARQAFPYRDRPVEELRYDVGEVLAGGAGLQTNQVTYRALADLQRIRGGLERAQRRHAVLTDGAAVWICAAGKNPLSNDWPQEAELGFSPALFRRVFADLRRLGPDGRIVVQKILFSHVDTGVWRVPPTWSYYALQNWVREHCSRERETEFFEIYLPPATPAAGGG